MQVTERTDFNVNNNLPGKDLVHRVNLKLAALGCAPVESRSEQDFQEVAWAILNTGTGLGTEPRLCPVDRRIQAFLSRYLEEEASLPARTFVLDEPGLARALSIPAKGDDFASPILTSYRVKQGVLHNPKSDRRTTQGIFHIAEGGLPIPDDKIAVPKGVFGKLFKLAFLPPRDLLRVPFTAEELKPAELFVSLLLRPVVCPEVALVTAQKTMEIRFFAPGSLVSNLDFVERIFGNGGDPGLAENDAGLDVEHWNRCVQLPASAILLRGVSREFWRDALGSNLWNGRAKRKQLWVVGQFEIKNLYGGSGWLVSRPVLRKTSFGTLNISTNGYSKYARIEPLASKLHTLAGLFVGVCTSLFRGRSQTLVQAA